MLLKITLNTEQTRRFNERSTTLLHAAIAEEYFGITKYWTRGAGHLAERVGRVEFLEWLISRYPAV